MVLSVLSVPASTGLESVLVDGLGRFPTAEMVSAAAALFAREALPESPVWTAPEGRVAPDGRLYPSAVKTLALFGPERVGVRRDWVEVEGPRWRVEVAPGAVSVRRRDYARARRAEERAREQREAEVARMVARLENGLDLDEPEARGRVVRCWSARSRAKMVQRLGELDYAGFVGGNRVPAMVTLTYPGDWLTVAPSAQVARRHVDALRKRFERDWSQPLVGIWKREFQRRGAPHYHVLMVPPAGTRNGQRFSEWLSQAWADVVGHPDPEQRERHVLAGTGIDHAEGARALDPVRLSVYFAKHGSFAAKEYQNEAPAEWLHEVECPAYRGEQDANCEGCSREGVGRFWGYWRLKRAVEAVEIAPDVALALVRTMRREARSRRYYVQRRVWRKVRTVDRATGELGWRWRRRTVRVPVLRMRHTAGTLLVNDGPAYASQLAVVARQATSTRRVTRSGAGPVGFLP